jgi:hypothetical protein
MTTFIAGPDGLHDQKRKDLDENFTIRGGIEPTRDVKGFVLGHFPFYFPKRISSQYDVIQAHFPRCEAGPHRPLGDCASAHALAPRNCGHDAPSSTTDGGEYLVCAKTKLKLRIPIEYKFILETTAQPFRHHGNLITGNKSKLPALAQFAKWLDQCSGCTFGGLECRRQSA